MTTTIERPAQTKMLSYGQFCEKLGVTEPTVRAWEKEDKGFPRARRIGPRVTRFLASDVEAFIDRTMDLAGK